MIKEIATEGNRGYVVIIFIIAVFQLLGKRAFWAAPGYAYASSSAAKES